MHGLCGTANCTESKNHKNVLWTAIRTEEDLRNIKGGSSSSHRQYYYLTTNIALNNTSWNPTGYISLCLNGYSITANGNFDTITVGEGKDTDSLTLCDCNGSGNNTGEITHVDGMKGRGVYLKPFSDLSCIVETSPATTLMTTVAVCIWTAVSSTCTAAASQTTAQTMAVAWLDV